MSAPSERNGAGPNAPQQRGIDPRGLRFSAGITAALLLVVVLLASATADHPVGSVTGRVSDPALIVFAVVTGLFAWGAFAGIRRHPYGLLFRVFIRPRLSVPTELEDPKPPTFAQGVGLVITATGLVLALFGVPYALVIAASAAFFAAFLNSVFGYCLGCQLYILLIRVAGRTPSPSSGVAG